VFTIYLHTNLHMTKYGGGETRRGPKLTEALFLEGLLPHNTSGFYASVAPTSEFRKAAPSIY